VGLDDREEIMGFRAGHTLAGLNRHEKHDKQLEIDVRRSLVGNSFSCQSLALLLGVERETEGEAKAEGAFRSVWASVRSRV
jgi:hypothetical protein